MLLRLGFAGLPLAFWLALFVLVLNDHVLKGSGLVPAILTGKLSDFAGLIVAPVVSCAAFSARADRTRGALIALWAIGFAAIKLSPALADGAGRLLTAIGIPSRIWCDPTDLIAFAVLPLSALLAQRVQPMPPRLSRRFAIGAAALACLATSEAGPVETELHGPFLINWTHSSIDVEVTRSSVACGGSDPDFESEEVVQRYTLGPAHMAELGWQLDSSDAGPAVCGRVDIEIGDAKQRVTWQPGFSDPMTREVESAYVPDQDDIETWQVAHDDDWAFERGVTVYGSASAPLFDVGELLEESEP